MTKREFFTNVINSITDAELIEFAKNELDKMDARNSARSSKPSKKSIENEPIKRAILEYLTTSTEMTSPDIAANCGISTQKASSLCIQLVNEGKLKVTEVKIPKRGKLKAYSLV